MDATQPAAAVLDPSTGAVRGIVSWAEQPPGPPGQQFPPPRVLGDGSSLWVQQEGSGPLVRVDPEGVAVAVWTRGLLLAACGPGVAWCAPPEPDRELVQGADAQPVRALIGGRLLRVARDGGCTEVRVDNPVRGVQAETDALLVEVDVDAWSLELRGVETYEVMWNTRWLRLPWDADVPETVSVSSHGLPPGDGPGRHFDDGGRVYLGGYGPNDEDPSAFAGRQWQLGYGSALAAAPVQHRLVVAVARGKFVPYDEPPPVDLAVLDPRAEQVQILLAADSVDITEQCWPLVPRPLDADSYAQQILNENRWLDEDGMNPVGGLRLDHGMSDARTSMVGDWPDTHLEWTFAFEGYPGLRLRRRVPLFGELGRAVAPEVAYVHLVEDLDTRALPPTSDARDGVIDI